MFNIFNRSQLRYPTIRQALVAKGLSAASDGAQVAVLEKQGQYAGRPVNFFRAYAPEHQDVALASGHVERDGMVVVYSRLDADGAAPARAPANRADHADDERLVFWDAAAARLSEAALSAPAETWLHARRPVDPGVTP